MHGRSNYVALRPDVMPAHIFRITREPGTEIDTKLTSAPVPAEISE